MRHLTKLEASAYLRDFCTREYAHLIDSSKLDRNDFAVTIELDDRSCQFAYLSKLVVEWMDSSGELVLLVNDYGIWPSREDLNLYRRLRQSNGDARPLFEAPGHLFFSEDSADLASFFYLALQFGWGGLLASGRGKLAHFSHDGWIGLVGQESQRIQDAWTD